MILYHLLATTAAEVEALLSAAGFSPPGDPPDEFWRYPDLESTVLYVAVDEDDYREFRRIDEDEYRNLVEALGGREPSVNVFVEVSNNRPGFAEVDMLTTLLLKSFPGCARDEYTEHHWTFGEIQDKRIVDGVGFFNAPVRPEARGMTKARRILACLLCLGFLSCRSQNVCEHPEIASRSIESLDDGHVAVVGSWKSYPGGWAPFALVRVECRREPAECTEFWAQLVADEHGRRPNKIIPELTRYRIETWSADEIRATGMFRERWPVELTVDPKTGSVRRQYPAKRDRSGGSEYWILE